MLTTTLIASMLIGCAEYRPHPMPPPPPQVVTLRCEGADQVRRVNGAEIDRWSTAPMCSQVRCERSDFVRRDSSGREMERWVSAPRCFVPPPPVRLTTTPGWKFGLTQS